jgi:hypothetical protein
MAMEEVAVIVEKGMVEVVVVGMIGLFFDRRAFVGRGGIFRKGLGRRGKGRGEKGVFRRGGGLGVKNLRRIEELVVEVEMRRGWGVLGLLLRG